MKKLTLMLTAVLTAGLLAACGNSFDAAGYTKALLDNSYKNDSTAFVEMEIGTAEEAAEIYEQGLDAEMDAMLSSAGITEDQAEGYREVFADLLAGAKYTVGEAEKQEDGSFVVTISYEQMNVFGPAMAEYETVVNDMVAQWTADAEATGEVPTEDEMYAAIMGELKGCLEKAIANATYDEAATTTVRIELKDGQYAPNEEDVANLEMVLFDLEDLAGIE